MGVTRVVQQDSGPLPNGRYGGGRRAAAVVGLVIALLVALALISAPFVPDIVYPRKRGRPFGPEVIAVTVLVALAVLAWVVVHLRRSNALLVSGSGIHLLGSAEIDSWGEIEGGVLLRRREVGRVLGLVLLNPSGDPLCCVESASVGAGVVQRLGARLQDEGKALFQFTGPVSRRMLAGGTGWQAFTADGEAT